MSGVNDFPPVHDELNLLTTTKILQWNNQSRLESGSSGALVSKLYPFFPVGEGWFGTKWK